MRSFFNIRNRILSVFLITGALVLVGGVLIAVFSIRNEATFRVFADRVTPRYVTLVEMHGIVSQIDVAATELSLHQSGTQDQDPLLLRIIALSGQIEQLYEDYRALGADEGVFSSILEQKESLLLGVVAYNHLHEEKKQALLERESGVEVASTTEVATLDEEVVALTRIHDESKKLLVLIGTAFEAEQIIQERAGELVATSANRAVTLIYLGIVLVLLVLVTMTALFRRWIWQPLGHLRTVSLAIAKGNSDMTADIVTRDEIGDVARAFNLMLLRVRHAQQEVEQKAKKLSDTLLDLGRLQKQTSEERALYELLLVSIGDAVLVVSPQLEVTLANLHAEEILKRDQDELVHKKITDLFDLTYRDGQRSLDDTILWQKVFTDATPLVFQDELTLKDARGIAVPVALVVAPVLDENKKVQNLVVTFRDITELVRLEEARVSFISSASHQLRTPLSSMRWFTEMLLEGDLGAVTEKQHEALATFSESTLRMIALVNALLQLSRVEARRVAVKPTPIDLLKLSEEVATSLQSEALQKKQTITVRAEGLIPTLPLDKELVWQVIMNYLTNALRYGTEGSEVAVTLRADAKYITVSVENDGIGIPENAQGRIFEKFYRADNARQSVPNGNGIGLAFVKTLAEDWGGTVGFTSVPNEKTTFWFTVPAKGMKERKGEVSLAV